MPVAYLTTPGLRITVSGEHLVVDPPEYPETRDRSPRRTIPLFDLEQVVVDATVHAPIRTVHALLERGIPLLFVQNGHFPAGQALPLVRATHVLAEQLDRMRDPGPTLTWARAVVMAKVNNQRRVLQRLASNRTQAPAAAVDWLGRQDREIAACTGFDRLRGLEGAAAGQYFEALSLYFPPELPFERRSRRPPHNPPNALLSFLYTLLTQELTLHLRAIGLEPGWGFLHETADGRPALSLDLLEPFRAPVADALSLDLLNHRRLRLEDFEYRDGGCFLRAASRRTLYGAFEDRMEREFLLEQYGHRTCLRQILKDQCAQIKAAIVEDKPFTPYLMN